MPIENTESTFKLQDRTVLVAGPCGGMVQSLAHKFTQMGANVVLVNRDGDKAKRFASQLQDAREINERYGRIISIEQTDFSSPSKIAETASRSAEAFGGIDIYVDTFAASAPKPFRETDPTTDLDRMIETNLRVPLQMTHAVLRFLEGRKRGRVIYLIHEASRTGLRGTSLMAATRTGLIAFARGLARETAELSITVNCVGLGVTEDFLQENRALFSTSSTPSLQEMQSQFLLKHPGATMMEPEKIANAVAFLASPLSSGVTGQMISASQGLI